jgi:hypothetical protein
MPARFSCLLLLLAETRLFDQRGLTISANIPHIWLESAGQQFFENTSFHALTDAVTMTEAAGNRQSAATMVVGSAHPRLSDT